MRAKILRASEQPALVCWPLSPGAAVRGVEPVEGIRWQSTNPEPEAEPPSALDDPHRSEPPPEAGPVSDSAPHEDHSAVCEALRSELASVREEIPGLVRRARTEGQEAGFGEGVRHGEAAAAGTARDAARTEYEQALAAAVESARDTLESRGRMRKQMEEDLVHLAVAVARRILHRELHVDPEALTGIVKAAIERIDVREVHRIIVAPYDATFVKKHFESLRLPERVEIAADGSLPRGSVVFETARGHVDASVETQLQEIDRGFADLVRRT